jgi:hypothetical protein
MKRTLISIARNWRGKSWGKNQIAFECDDWGSLGVPSHTVINDLRSKGLPISEDRFQQIDVLEQSEDVESLLNVLAGFKDHNGNSPVFSCFFNVANPDFEKISQDRFEKYYCVDLDQTYEQFSDGQKAKEMIKEGVRSKLLCPEFHGREHLAVEAWMSALRKGNKWVRMAFDKKFLPYSPLDSHPLGDKLRAKFFVENPQDLITQAESIQDGLALFERFFGKKAKVFNAPNGVFAPQLNPTLIANSIQTTAVPFVRKEWTEKTGFKEQSHYSGEISPEGMTYYVRNCNFEPGDPAYRGVNHVLQQVAGAFLMGKPAVISTHRINFVGGNSPENKLKGAKELAFLLQELLKKWPNLEFVSSKKLSDQIHAKIHHPADIS